MARIVAPIVESSFWVQECVRWTHFSTDYSHLLEMGMRPVATFGNICCGCHRWHRALKEGSLYPSLTSQSLPSTWRSTFETSTICKQNNTVFNAPAVVICVRSTVFCSCSVFQGIVYYDGDGRSSSSSSL